MVNVDPTKRPTIDELSKDPWMQKPYDVEGIRNKIIAATMETESAAQEEIEEANAD